MTKPITPAQVAKHKAKAVIPVAVIDVVNDLIAQKWNGHSATVLQEEIVSVLVAKGFDRDEIFDKNWLDFEPIYRKVGWEVVFDKPGFNETYSASFEFKEKS